VLCNIATRVYGWIYHLECFLYSNSICGSQSLSLRASSALRNIGCFPFLFRYRYQLVNQLSGGLGTCHRFSYETSPLCPSARQLQPNNFTLPGQPNRSHVSYPVLNIPEPQPFECRAALNIVRYSTDVPTGLPLGKEPYFSWS